MGGFALIVVVVGLAAGGAALNPERCNFGRPLRSSRPMPVKIAL